MNELTSSLLALLFAGSITLSAQVTIGSAKPASEGTLLDIKSEDDGSSKGGISLPKVKLKANDQLMPMFEPKDPSDFSQGYKEPAVKADEDAKHVGLLVYNTNIIEGSKTKLLCPGLLVWTGTTWIPLKPLVPGGEKTLVREEIIKEKSRTPLPAEDPNNPLGFAGYLEDVRGDSDTNMEYNIYPTGRFRAESVVSEVKRYYNGYDDASCTPEVYKEWDAIEEVTSIDEDIYFLSNLNTKFLPQVDANNKNQAIKLSIQQIALREPNYCYPSNTEAGLTSLENNTVWNSNLGLLYNWYAAINIGNNPGQKPNPGNTDEGETSINVATEKVGPQGICPDGWHILSDYEWNRLEQVIHEKSNTFSTINNLGSWTLPWNTTANNLRGTLHGAAMKSASRMAEAESEPNAISTNYSFGSIRGGFNAYNSGTYRNNELSNWGNGVYFWTSSASSVNNAWFRRLYAYLQVVFRGPDDHFQMFNVRCKKNSSMSVANN